MGLPVPPSRGPFPVEAAPPRLRFQVTRDGEPFGRELCVLTVAHAALPFLRLLFPDSRFGVETRR